MTTISPKEFLKGGNGKITIVGSDHEQIQTANPSNTPNYLERVWGDFKNRANNIIKDVNVQPGKNLLDTTKKVAEAGLRTVGQVAGGAADIITEAPGVKPLIKGAVGLASTSDKITGRDLKKDIADVTQSYNGWAAKHPDASKDLEAVINIASILAPEKPTQAIVDNTSKVAGKTGAKILSKTSEAATQAGRATKATGEVVYKSAITPTVKEAEKILNYEAKTPFLTRVEKTLKGEELAKPITRATTALDKGLSGTERAIGVQAKRATQTLWNDTISPALKNSKEVVTKEDLFKPITDRIATMVEPGRKKALSEAFSAIQDEYKGVKQFTLEEAQKVKEALAEFVPDKVYRGKPIASEYRTLQADMADAIRQKIYNSLSDINIKKSYLDYANLKELEKIGVKSISEGGFKGGFGAFWSSMWDAATTPVKTIGGKVLYRVGGKLEFMGEKGIKKFGDYLKKQGFKP
jgi:hypothetical protein